MDQDSQSHYHLMNDNKSTSSEKLTHQFNFHDDERDDKTTFSHPQQVLHNYQNLNSRLEEVNSNHQNDYRQPLQKGAYPSLQSINSHNHIQLQNQLPNGSHQPHNCPRVEVIVHNNVPIPPQIGQSQLHVAVEGAIMYAQTVPCQRCGLVSEGPLSLKNGGTVWAWGTGLFLLTGLFCFLPCVIDKCKDTEVSCPRCGHKKAVVKSKCCC